MRIDIGALFTDPALMFYGFEGDHVRFVPMTRDSYARSIFFDQRIKPAEQRMIRVPLDLLLRHLAESGFKPPRLHFIHHMAQTGSTLLARALDQGSRSLVIREPFHLRQVGANAGAGFDPAFAPGDWRALLGLSLTMLGKRYNADAPVIVKGNVPISLIADAIAEADPGQSAILLHFPLDHYCAAVLRTPDHQKWVESVTREIRLGGDPNVGDIGGLGIAEKAAALWFSLVKRYEKLLATHPAMASLDANRLFDQPVDTIVFASDLMGVGLTSVEAEAVVTGPLFSSYAKNPDEPYEPATRIERRNETMSRLADDLLLARRWVEQRAAAVGLPTALDRPLIGAPSPLL